MFKSTILFLLLVQIVNLTFGCSKECSECFKCVINTNGEERCVRKPECSPEAIRRCRLNVEEGYCYGYMPMFYYNKYYGRCQSFNYGGCGGNVNKFETEKECADTCGNVGGLCPVAKLLPPPKGCEYKTLITLTGCDSYVLMCPGLGCATNPCKDCQFCKNKFDEKCDYFTRECKPIGHECETDPICEIWKERDCKKQNCPADTECRYDINKGATCVTV